MQFEEKAKEHNRSYIEKTDWRVKKPHVIFHEDDVSQKIVLANNWVLESNKLETMLDTPNDVAIYSSISMKALNNAKEFHETEIQPRINYGYPSKTLKQHELIKYYDYFETIISSVVFAYTSIEAFANICLPKHYIFTYIDKKGQTIEHDKETIEREYPLRDKLKKVLPDILDCEPPQEQGWWSRFTELENLRNEIIHSKESKSEDRYSKLLSSTIFKKVEIHKEVIEFFGISINKNKKELLDEYPNGFGFDIYKVKKLSDEKFKKSKAVITK